MPVLTTLSLAIRHADALAAGDLEGARNLAEVDAVLALAAERDAAQASAYAGGR